VTTWSISETAAKTGLFQHTEVLRQMAAQQDCLKLLDTKIDIYTRQLQQER